MEQQKSSFPVGLTFDDVLLLPGYSDFSRDAIDLSIQLSKTIKLSLPLISSPMDTVTESTMAITLGKLGGMGIIHRNLTSEDQAAEVKKVKDQNVPGGAAVGASAGYEERVEVLVKAGVDAIVIDTAHGYVEHVLDAISAIKNRYSDITVIAGSIATYEGAEALIQAGADTLRVGMGPGAICTTRIISGMGVPQITAIMETARAAKATKTPIIADGGIKYSGDMVKALAAGASACMMGSFFASCKEAPGKIVELSREQVPQRFKSILSTEKEIYTFKEYRGMGSIGVLILF